MNPLVHSKKATIQVSELMSFARPDVKSLLGQITSVSLTSGETEAKSVKIAVIKFH